MTPTFRSSCPSPGRVLVIDDNRDLAENLAEVLGARGFDVEVAADGRAGVARAVALKPQVCLIDLNLPDMNGLDVLTQVRDRSPCTECVVLTGYAALDNAVEALNRGAFAYGIKGLKFDDVIAAVDRACERARMRDERLRLEAALRAQQALLSAVIDEAPLGMLVVTPRGHVLRQNRVLRTLLSGGQPGEGEAEGAEGGAFPASVGDDGADRSPAARLTQLGSEETDREAIAEVMGGGRGRAEVKITGPASTERTLRLFGSVVRTEGAPLPAEAEEFMVIVTEDVTEQRRLERQAQRASRLAAIGELSARVAHEIRNPLAGIASAIRVLARGFQHDPMRSELAKELLAQVGRLDTFVEDLLVMARPVRLRREPITLSELLETPLRELERHPAVRGMRIDLAGDLDHIVRVDRRLFGLVVDNLVLNAAQLTKEDGWMGITARRTDGAVTLAFEDNGPGIEPRMLPVIFEPFETTRVEGTGLGLSTTLRIIESHGGKITAENRDEGGACFLVVLPDIE